MWLIWCVTVNLTSSLTLMLTLITPQWPTVCFGFHHAIVYDHTYGQHCDMYIYMELVIIIGQVDVLYSL